MNTVRIRLKPLLLVPIDILAVIIGYFLTLYILFPLDNISVPSNVNRLIYSPATIVVIAIYILSFAIFEMYYTMLAHISIYDMFKGLAGNIVGTNMVFLFNNFVLPRVNGSVRFPNSFVLIAGLLIMFFTLGIRVLPRVVSSAYRSFVVRFLKKPANKVLVYGAGNAGIALHRDLANNVKSDYKVICFYDDDLNKSGTKVSGLKVYGPSTDLVTLTDILEIDTIIIAVPSATPEQMSAIIEKCNKTKCKLKTLPALYDLIIDGYLDSRQIRDVNIYDILGRKEAKIDIDGISGYINNKTILVTGAGGSIGSEICRQILSYKPKRLVLVDIYENNVYDLENELKFIYKDELPIKIYIGSIRDYKRMDYIFNVERPDVVFHAAAHKHVPLMEDSPGEAIKNNVFGTLNIVELSKIYRVSTFVLISTDKAVNPTNVMGATKRIAEMIIQSYAKKDNNCVTKYVAVRFGNVLGSNGSVVQLFQKQIANMGPVTVTDPEVTRYFMTIPEASRLVIQAGAMAQGGEIFILDMGKPIKIANLAEDMIRLSGYTPHVDIKIVYTGLRPGEKLYEELLQAEEGTTKTCHDSIFVGKPFDLHWEDVAKMLEELERCADCGDDDEIISVLMKCVPTYKPMRNHQIKPVSINVKERSELA
ncbi:MAG: polysaccharide biosynthesis protein [Clostridiaceae bacterium]|nr:polysaccharide biosynthesis protein [Clostridiaceae bacterium]